MTDKSLLDDVVLCPRELLEAAEKINLLAVQKAQMTAQGFGNDPLYRDYMDDGISNGHERQLDEAFQVYYDAKRAPQEPNAALRRLLAAAQHLHSIMACGPGCATNEDESLAHHKLGEALAAFKQSIANLKGESK